MRDPTMDPAEFGASLEREMLRGLARVGEQVRLQASGSPPLALMVEELRAGLEAAEVAALWMDEPDLELRLGFARKVGDGERHYRLLADVMRVLGAEPAMLDPGARTRGPLFRYLKGLTSPAERLAAGIAHESAARLRSAVLAEGAEARGDAAGAQVFRDVVGPDSAWHLEFRRRMLPRYALAAEDQERARHAAARTVQLLEEGAEPARPARSTTTAAAP